ncbi:MAG: TRAP transporter small permease [Alphaproteobacteria bacterium]|nr:TRAP transporter small permease [Alphaproteobacteria bacterium]
MSDATEGAGAQTPAPQKHTVPEGPVEIACKWACEAALLVMLVVIGTDIFTRWAFNFSFQVSDEIGGYMLAVITFLSLSVCQVSGSFHHVEIIQARLSERGRVLSALVFDLLTLGFAGLLVWHYIRLELSSWRFGERAPTYLETPLWIPRLVMAIGAAALCLAVLRTLAMHVRRLKDGSPRSGA